MGFDNDNDDFVLLNSNRKYACEGFFKCTLFISIVEML